MPAGKETPFSGEKQVKDKRMMAKLKGVRGGGSEQIWTCGIKVGGKYSLLRKSRQKVNLGNEIKDEIVKKISVGRLIFGQEERI